MKTNLTESGESKVRILYIDICMYIYVYICRMKGAMAD